MHMSLDNPAYLFMVAS